VLLLLRLEHRESGQVSAASWIPTIWLMSVSSKPLAIWFNIPGTNEGGSFLDQLLLLGLAGSGLAVLAQRRYHSARALQADPWLLFLLSYTFLSAFWSDMTLVSLRRWLRDGIVVIMALVVMSEGAPRQAVGSILRRVTYVLIPYSYMLIHYYPALGRDYAHWSGLMMWSGVTLHKNGLGRVCMVSVAFLLWDLHRRRRDPALSRGRYQKWADIAILLMSLYLLKGPDNAYSATSLGTLFTGIVGYLGLLWVRRVRQDIPGAALQALILALVVFGTAQPFVGGTGVANVSSGLGRDETLTGRTEIWAELVPVVKQQPILGSGYASYWTTARRELHLTTHGHNGYLDTLLDLGAAGLAFYTMWLLSCVRRLHGAFAEDFHWAGFGTCLVLMAVVYNVTESALTSLSHELMATIVLMVSVLGADPAWASGRPRTRHRGLAPATRSGATDPLPVGLTNRRASGAIHRPGRWSGKRAGASARDLGGASVGKER
jgi:O-antigen ligase